MKVRSDIEESEKVKKRDNKNESKRTHMTERSYSYSFCFNAFYLIIIKVLLLSLFLSIKRDSIFVKRRTKINKSKKKHIILMRYPQKMRWK